jgi:DNA polymerase III subunit delta
MPAVSADRLLENLARGKLGGVYFLYGDEEFLKEEAAQSIVAAHLDPATRDFNFDELRGTSVEPETLASVCATPPMLAEWRVVVLRDAQALGTNGKLRSAVETQVHRPQPGLVLILVAQLPDRSKAKVWEQLKKAAKSAEFSGLSAADVPGWLIERAAAGGKTLEPEAARSLAAAVGTELGVLTQELAKLTGYVGDRGSITLADIADVVGAIPRQNRWDWFDMVGERRFAEARAALHVLLDGPESGVGLVIGLGTHFLRLALAADGGERALGAALPPHQRWLAGRVARQARRWTLPALESALDDLLRADRLLKSASLGEHPVMEELLLRMEGFAAGAAA